MTTYQVELIVDTRGTEFQNKINKFLKDIGRDAAKESEFHYHESETQYSVLIKYPIF